MRDIRQAVCTVAAFASMLASPMAAHAADAATTVTIVAAPGALDAPTTQMNPGSIPQTGDVAWAVVLVLMLAGAALIIAGIMGHHRARKPESDVEQVRDEVKEG